MHLEEEAMAMAGVPQPINSPAHAKHSSSSLAAAAAAYLRINQRPKEPHICGGNSKLPRIKYEISIGQVS